jgi:hypothetical protein
MNESKTSHVISFCTFLSALRAKQLGSYTAGNGQDCEKYDQQFLCVPAVTTADCRSPGYPQKIYGFCIRIELFLKSDGSRL